MYTCAHRRAHVHIYTHKASHSHIQIHTASHMHAHAHTHTRKDAHTQTRMPNMHMHHAHTRTHTHTCNVVAPGVPWKPANELHCPGLRLQCKSRELSTVTLVPQKRLFCRAVAPQLHVHKWTCHTQKHECAFSHPHT